jgi:hypothetical protein
MDDVGITGPNKHQHLQNLEEVLARLEAAGLRLRLEKCRFFIASMEYMGIEINADGIHPMSEKVRAVKEAPAPTTFRNYVHI